jgi:N-formylglutamate amidohydrolase
VIELYRFRRGRTPLLVSMPHTGTQVPEWLAPRLTRAAKALPDTDWHLEPLYDFLDELGASVLVATHSRYVVDLNRPPDNADLYPGQDTTGVVPLDTFHSEPIYLPGFPPSEEEKNSRIKDYWKPYRQARRHARGAEERARLCASLGRAFHPLGPAAVLRREAARLQPRHRRRQVLQAGAGGKALGHSEKLFRCAQRPLQGRVYHPHLR